MVLKIFVLLLVLIVLIAMGAFALRKKIRHYDPFTWALVEGFWYTVSFSALCIGLMEIDRIEKVNKYNNREQALAEDYYRKKSLLYAQTWLLKIESSNSTGEEAGIRWFHKMKALFDEGLYTNRWEEFLNYTRAYALKDPAVHTNISSNAVEFGWPRDPHLPADSIFLKDEIRWVADSLSNIQKRKVELLNSKPKEFTDYRVRYLFVIFFLLGLSLKFVKIYADYRHKLGR